MRSGAAMISIMEGVNGVSTVWGIQVYCVAQKNRWSGVAIEEDLK